MFELTFGTFSIINGETISRVPTWSGKQGNREKIIVREKSGKSRGILF